MKVITFLNQKGGVGKTSTCLHLGGAMADIGWRVLLIDNDPQASLTQGLLGPERTEELNPGDTVAVVYAGDVPPRLPTVDRRLEFVAGSWRIADHNWARPEESPPAYRSALRSYLREELVAQSELPDPVPLPEFVLIDCPPNLGLLSWAALVASDGVVVPVQAEDFGAQGLAPMREFIERVTFANPGLRTLGYLITMFDSRPSLPRLYEGRLREKYLDLVFKAVVPRSVDFPEAVMARSPVSHARPRGKAAAAMTQVAWELIGRLGVKVNIDREVIE